MYSRASINLIILFSFLSSILLSIHYVSKYDQLKFSTGLNRIEHPMIKIAITNHWAEADKILKDIKNGKSLFFSGGDYNEFLPQRLLALYYYVIGDEIYDKDQNFKPNNGKLLYLIIKTALYYLALIYFSSKIISIFPIKNCFFIILFLAFEPSIFQYHSSFWNESLFFPLQILLLTLIILQPSNFFSNLFLGFLLGVMFTISQETFFYFVPLIFYLLLIFKKKSLKPILGLLVGYIVILSIISFHNYKRTGTAYFMTYGSKTSLYLYLAPQVLSIKENLSVDQAQKKIRDKKKIWIEKNNINLELSNNNFNNLGRIENKDEQLKYYNYLQRTALDIIIKNPFSTLKYIFTQNLHTLVLDPFYVKYFYQFDARGKNQYYKSETQQRLIPFRIIYTIIVYLIMIIGLIYSSKDIKKEITLILIIFASYPIFVLGWMGTNRYFVPALIFLSIFFGNGISTILNIKKIKYKKNS